LVKVLLVSQGNHKGKKKIKISKFLELNGNSYEILEKFLGHLGKSSIQELDI
jgi:hypothetical protein